MLGDQWPLLVTTQDTIHLASMTLAQHWIAQCQWVAQHFFKWNLLVSQHRVARRDSHHQFVLPRTTHQNTLAHFVRHRESNVIHAVIQTPDLLVQRHLKQPNIDLGFLLSASR